MSEESQQPKVRKKKSLGERRLRTSFNPSNNSMVDQIKQRGAELFNLINDNVHPPDGLDKEDLGEFYRHKNLALTDIEKGASWGVKAATTRIEDIYENE